MQPFNLDRFRAGEPAIDKDNSENFYLADLPDGRIAVKYIYDDEWQALALSIEYINNKFNMKEKELTWEEVRIMWLNLDVGNVFQWLDENFELPKRKNK